MTDEQIIKALECCKSETPGSCRNCPLYKMYTANCITVLAQDTIALINRQKAEIESLTNENKVLRDEADNGFEKWLILDKRTQERYGQLYQEAKTIVRAEAVKEFADEIIQQIHSFFIGELQCGRYSIDIASCDAYICKIINGMGKNSKSLEDYIHED